MKFQEDVYPDSLYFQVFPNHLLPGKKWDVMILQWRTLSTEFLKEKEKNNTYFKFQVCIF